MPPPNHEETYPEGALVAHPTEVAVPGNDVMEDVLVAELNHPIYPLHGAGFGTFTVEVGQVAGRSSGRVPHATLDRK